MLRGQVLFGSFSSLPLGHLSDHQRAGVRNGFSLREATAKTDRTSSERVLVSDCSFCQVVLSYSRGVAGGVRLPLEPLISHGGLSSD
jgi:hypothetical protein